MTKPDANRINYQPFRALPAWMKLRYLACMNTPTDATMPILLSKRRAADVLGISLRTVDNLIATGQLSVARVGRRVLLPRKALERFASAAGQRTSAGSPPPVGPAGSSNAACTPRNDSPKGKIDDQP